MTVIDIFLVNMFSASHIISSGGLLLIAAIIFAESGMFVGFFFPGDTLLIGAGVVAAEGKLSLIGLIVVVIAAAILGDNTGYQIGKRYGRKLFNKPDGLIFKKEYITQAETFFDKWGSKSMLLSHFVPVIRTFAPAVAGAAKMDRRSFFVFDAIGDSAWAVLVCLVGYFFGKKIPNIDHYILLGVAAVMIITLTPTLYQITKTLTARRSATKALEKPTQKRTKD
jgi:membrane-associated protein